MTIRVLKNTTVIKSNKYDTVTTITVHFTYIDKGSGSNDGLRFFSVVDYYNDPSLEIVSFGNIPLSRRDDTGKGNHFHGMKGKIASDAGSPTILSDTSLSFSFFKTGEMLTEDYGSVHKWDITKVTSLRGTFSGATNFNSDITSWNIENVTDLAYTFKNATKFNQDISVWQSSSVISMYMMLNGALEFDQNLGNLDLSNVESMKFMFSGTALSTEHYTAALIAWSKQTLLENVYLDSPAQYLSRRAHQILVSHPNYWNISDGGDGSPIDAATVELWWEEAGVCD